MSHVLLVEMLMVKKEGVDEADCCSMFASHPIILHTSSHSYKFLLGECGFLIFFREIQIFPTMLYINFLFAGVGLIGKQSHTGEPGKTADSARPCHCVA